MFAYRLLAVGKDGMGNLYITLASWRRFAWRLAIRFFWLQGRNGEGPMICVMDGMRWPTVLIYMALGNLTKRIEDKNSRMYGRPAELY